MKVWITKYALTKGIEKADGNRCTSSDDMISVVYTHGNWDTIVYYHGKNTKEWHTTRESAETRAEAMRLAKIASVKKKLAKLEKLSFS